MECLLSLCPEFTSSLEPLSRFRGRVEEDPETNEKRIGVGDDCRFELHIAFEARKQKFHCLNNVSCLCSTLVEAHHRHEMVLMQ